MWHNWVFCEGAVYSAHGLELVQKKYTLSHMNPPLPPFKTHPEPHPIHIDELLWDPLFLSCHPVLGLQVTRIHQRPRKGRVRNIKATQVLLKLI